MAYETNRYNVLYGKVSSLVKDKARAAAVTTALYNAGIDLKISNSDLLGFIKTYGFHYEYKSVYNNLNTQRTSSSQLGYIEIPREQYQNTCEFGSGYVGYGYVESTYVDNISCYNPCEFGEGYVEDPYVDDPYVENNQCFIK